MLELVFSLLRAELLDLLGGRLETSLQACKRGELVDLLVFGDRLGSQPAEFFLSNVASGLNQPQFILQRPERGLQSRFVLHRLLSIIV